MHANATGRVRIGLQLAALTLFALLQPAPAAAQLAITPTTVELHPGQAHAELWLHNRSASTWVGSAQVLAWRQHDAHDVLEPTMAVVASPSRLMLPPGMRQRVRLVLTASAPTPDGIPGADEQAYRLILQPHDTTATAWSLPLFVTASDASERPLTARLAGTPGQPCLSLSNPGRRRVRLQDLAFEDPRGRVDMLQPGLAGYVLAHARVCWPVPVRRDGHAGGRFRARGATLLAPTAAPIAARPVPGL